MATPPAQPRTCDDPISKHALHGAHRRCPMTQLTPPGAATSGPYEAREFDLTPVTGLSPRAIELHLELYQGYVKAFNTLLSEQSAAFPPAGEAAVPLDL